MIFLQRLLITTGIFFTILLLTTKQPSLPVPYTSFGEIKKIEQPSIALAQESFLSTEGAYNRVLFWGDVMLARHVETLSMREGVHYPFSALDRVSSTTAIVANFEASMAVPHRRTPDYMMRFSAPESSLGALRAAGVTHVSLANNHSFDHGEVGLRLAQSKFIELGIIPIGNSHLVDNTSVSYIATDIGRVALVAINATYPATSVDDMTRTLKVASLESVYQFVYIHWGEEYHPQHSEGQEKLAKLLVEQGADAIIGHHPHVVQDVGVIDGVPVFYSLGNFIFDQYFSDEVKQGLVLEFNTTPAPNFSLQFFSTIATPSRPARMGQEQEKQALARLAARSDVTLTKEIEAGKVQLLPPVASSKKIAIMVR